MKWFKGKISRREFLTATGLTALAAGCSRFIEFDELNEDIKDKSKYPIVIIGAGVGGLTAAAYLTKYGFPVTVIESHYIPGGYATSFERGRFEFEVSLHQTSAKNSSTEEILRETGIYDEIEVVACPELCRIITPSNDVTLPFADPKGYVEKLAELFPSEKNNIDSFLNEIIKIRDDASTIPDKLGLWGIIRFPSKYPEIWNLRGKSLSQLLDRHTKNEKLRSMLSVFWPYYGLSPSKLSALYYAIAMGGYIQSGGYYYKPRSQALSNAAVKIIKDRGGKVIFNEEVKEVVFEEDKIAGVKTNSGEFYKAALVLSNASAPKTFSKLVPEDKVPKDYSAQLAKYKPSISTFLVWLGLKGDIRKISKTYETFVNEHTYDHEQSYKTCMQCDAKTAPFVVNLYDNLWDGYSKPGTSTVGLLVMSGYEPWKKFEEDYLKGHKDNYKAHKAELAKTLISRAEKTMLPGLSSMIEEIVTASPLTNVSFTGNPGGAIYGYAQSPDNAMDSRNPNRTPINGLYLSSAWGFPGGGFTGAQVGARNAVKNLMEDLG